MARRLDWDAERGRQRLASTSGSGTGEGSRPAPESPARQPLPVIVVAVRLSESDKRRLGGRAGQVTKAMPHLRSARLAVIAKEKRVARQQTLLAWKLLRPVVAGLRRTGDAEDLRLATRLVRPVRSLLDHGVRLDIPDLDPGGVAVSTGPSAGERATRTSSTPAWKAGTSASTARPSKPTAPPRGRARGAPLVCLACFLALSAAGAAAGLRRHDSC